MQYGLQCMQHLLLCSVMQEPCPNPDETNTTQISFCCASSVVDSPGHNVCNTNFSGLSCLCHVPVNVQFAQHNYLHAVLPLLYTLWGIINATPSSVVCHAGAMSQWMCNLHNTHMCFLGFFCSMPIEVQYIHNTYCGGPPCLCHDPMNVRFTQHQYLLAVLPLWYTHWGPMYATPTSVSAMPVPCSNECGIYTTQISTCCASWYTHWSVIYATPTSVLCDAGAMS